MCTVRMSWTVRSWTLSCIAPFKRRFVTKNQIRSLKLSSVSAHKIHAERENDYTYSLINKQSLDFVTKQQKERLETTGFQKDLLSRKWADEDPANLYKLFVTISQSDESIDIEDDSFTNFIKALSVNVGALDDRSLLAVVYFLRMWNETESPASPNYKILWNALDSECVKRLKTWNISTSLSVADLWYSLNLARIGAYNKAMLTKLINESNRLDVHELLQVLFFTSVQRSCNPRLMAKVEKQVEYLFDEMTTEQLSILALAFFKTQTKVSSVALMERIFHRLFEHIDKLPDLTITAFAKFLRHSSNAKLLESYDKLLTTCVPLIDRLSPTTVLHLALMTTTTHLDHRNFLETMTPKIESQLPELRLKELAKFLHCLTKFDRAPEPSSTNFYKNIFSEIKKPIREQEIQIFPSCMVTILLNLTFCGIFPEDLLDRYLSAAEVNQLMALHKDWRELFNLDCALEIELPNYTGNRLSPSLRRKFWQLYRYKHGHAIATSQSTFHEKLVWKASEILSKRLGDGTCVIHPTLPHYDWPDIVIHEDTAKLSSFVEAQKTSLRFTLPERTEQQWRCVVIGHRGCYSGNNRRSTALFKAKLRQLKKIGYNVIEVPWFEFSNVSTLRKEEHLFRKLNFKK